MSERWSIVFALDTHDGVHVDAITAAALSLGLTIKKHEGRLHVSGDGDRAVIYRFGAASMKNLLEKQPKALAPARAMSIREDGE